jgi:inhibitor of KinA sporulation pathway (predicted exonuclease)
MRDVRTNTADGTDVLLGTPAQVRYARNIRAHFRTLVGDPNHLPNVPLASFWIDQRNAASLQDLWDAASDTSGQLLYSPFVSHYPRWGRAEAVATLRLLDQFKVLDLETDGIGKAAQVLDVAVVDQDGVPLFGTLIRPPDVARLEDEEGKQARAANGITVEMVRDAPSLQDVWPRLVAVLTEPDTGILAAFNGDFDFRIIRNAAAREDVQVPALSGLCLMKLATAYFERDFYLSLDEAGILAGMARTAEEMAHRALGDVRYTARIIRHLRMLAAER